MMFVLYNAKKQVMVGAVDREGSVWTTSSGKDMLKPLAKIRHTEVGQKKPTHIVLCTPSNQDSQEEKPTWSQTRGASVIANTLAFAFDIPVYKLERNKKWTRKTLLRNAVELVHNSVPTTSWLNPLYDGEPNITS